MKTNIIQYYCPKCDYHFDTLTFKAQECPACESYVLHPKAVEVIYEDGNGESRGRGKVLGRIRRRAGRIR